MTFSPVHFSFDRVDLSNAAKDTLDGIARFMTDNSNARITVTGYTDSRGDDGYNARLGAPRDGRKGLPRVEGHEREPH